VRNVVARLAPYWNVVWNVAFEWQEFLSAGDVARISDLVRGLDLWHHLITVHDQGFFHTGAEVRSALHVDFPTLQYDAGKVPNAVTGYRLVRQFAGDWPVFAQEVTREGSTKLNADQVRRGAWDVALAGGINNYAEMFEGPNQGKPANYGDGGAFPYLAIMFDFLEPLVGQALEPHPELVNSAQLCLAHPGAQYVCYAPDGGATRVDLSGTTREYDVHWLNPRTGERLAGARIAGGGSVTFDSPFRGDAVLYLKAK
jgi:Putative collagen-binding domain of a collagenase